MAAKDGDGWAMCGRGHRHWGLHGASGLLAVHHDDDGTPHVLMQKRSWWSHHGGTWGLPGGARDSHEDVVASALREAREEAALGGEGLRVQGVYLDDHGGWSFGTVIAEAQTLLDAAPANAESAEMRWIPLAEVTERRLHPGFAETWPAIRPLLCPLVIVLDMANIVGARAEHGWWRDRAGAASRLLAEVSALARYGLRTPPEHMAALDPWYPRFVAVVEGAARDAESPDGVSVISAPRSGDDAIVAAVRDRRPWERVLVVTADRELRERVTAVGPAVSVTGPRWLLSQL
ncbi:8-oxo-dGTP pyrophosphatase MutT (NUDIX family) [Thermocatellispora tengchongensis]|uniref:8-oxo-dGTP pyrophosphatase MutT (NUDIX family) n=1 Tax=Thermocatellispora tengchongensis TaxID=1073253 RepID=A0A840NQC8_9ACTN|nr:NUDIX domain-containing protein [Thermocatellispora tengchongensis]MBB5130784.1 8-oxo-dGTP pyrophosphatase MutT (NUDIX family) [Thermocatellispora tengchongensis]